MFQLAAQSKYTTVNTVCVCVCACMRACVCARCPCVCVERGGGASE